MWPPHEHPSHKGTQLEPEEKTGGGRGDPETLNCIHSFSLPSMVQQQWQSPWQQRLGWRRLIFICSMPAGKWDLPCWRNCHPFIKNISNIVGGVGVSWVIKWLTPFPPPPAPLTDVRASLPVSSDRWHCQDIRHTHFPGTRNSRYNHAQAWRHLFPNWSALSKFSSTAALIHWVTGRWALHTSAYVPPPPKPFLSGISRAMDCSPVHVGWLHISPYGEPCQHVRRYSPLHVVTRRYNVCDTVTLRFWKLWLTALRISRRQSLFFFPLDNLRIQKRVRKFSHSCILRESKGSATHALPRRHGRDSS